MTPRRRAARRSLVAGLALGALAGVALDRGAAADGPPGDPAVGQRIVVVVPEHPLPTTVPTTGTSTPPTPPTTPTTPTPPTSTGPGRPTTSFPASAATTVEGGSMNGGASAGEGVDAAPDDRRPPGTGALPRTGMGPLSPALVVVGIALVAAGRAVLALARRLARRTPG